MTSQPTDQRERIEQRATAFVFGELDRDEATEFMRAMDASPALRDMVASIRDAVGALETEFQSDTEHVSQSDRQRIATAFREPHPAPPPVATLAPDAATRQWVTGLAVAATLLLACGLTFPTLHRVIIANTDTKELREKIRQIELENQRLSARNRAIERELQTAKASRESDGNPDQSSSIAGETDSTENISNAMSGGSQALGGQEIASPDVVSQESSGQRDSAESSDETNIRITDSSPSVTPAPPDDPTESTGNGSTTERQPRPNPMAKDEVALKEGVDDGEVFPDSIEMNNYEIDVAEGKTKSFPGSIDEMDMMMGGMEDVEMQMGMSESDDPMMEQEGMMGMGGMTIGGTRFGDASGDGGFAGGRAKRVRRPVDGNVGMEIDDLFPMGAMRGDRFAPIIGNSFQSVTKSPLSTFSIDVDTAAYAKVRMYLSQHRRLPDPDAVRIEELVNYFDYDYAPPEDDRPFAASLDVAGCPWNPQHRLARIGIKGRVIDHQRPPSNLVFLLDVSGSMNQPNKLPLVVDGMKMLVNQLGENDSVAIVVYAGNSGLMLDSTTGDRKKTIVDSLDRLRAGGSTNGGKGIQQAYSIARDNYIPGGTNRVILCTDGDFNVGVTDDEELVKMAEKNAKGNIFLSVLGFGTGNHNDSMMEQISNKGNGNYAFIDGKDEARKVLVEQMKGTLVTIAKDVKIQVEFNPFEVEAYRLIGYENRILAAEDFLDDTKDAGEIGAGHTVTALYEVVPKRDFEAATQGADRKLLGQLKYQQRIRYREEATSGEMLTLKLSYKPPTGKESTQIEFAVKDSGKSFNRSDQDFQFAASVAAFGMLLRNSPHKGSSNFSMVEEIAVAGSIDDRSGYRDEFVSLVKQARKLSGR